MATGNVLLHTLGFTLDETAPPGVEWLNDLPYVAFPAGVKTTIRVRFRVPDSYQSGPVLIAQTSMGSAVSGSVKLDCSLWKITPATAGTVTTPSYDAVNTLTQAVPTTLGETADIKLTLTNDDGIFAGDMLAMEISRDGAAAGDNASGDLWIHALTLQFTTP